MKLIVNADDAGIDASRNRGILEAIDKGVVRSISLIAGQAGFADAVKKFKNKKNISVGLHFNLTAGKPLARGLRALIKNEGTFFDKFELFKKAMAGAINPAEAARELQAQLAVFEATGITLSHLDGHNHVHLLPGVREAILMVMPKDTWVRLPFERNVEPQSPRDKDPKDVWNNSDELISVYNFFSLEAKKLWRGHFRHTDDFAGSKISMNPTLEAFKSAVEGLTGNICELMVHPGAKPDADSVRFSKLPERVEELKILRSAELKDFLKEKKIDIISFQDKQ